jgi:hypothetical protein
MSHAPGAAPPTSSARPVPATPAIIILGSDALLAVRPATPGQLTNACYAAGYSAVIPASWGDELVAAGCLNEIAARGQDSVVLCSCPRVSERLRRVGTLAPHLLAMASPPVLAARYLRARAGATGVHITYVGDCPGASDPAIDRHATPSALLRSLAKRGIVPSEQSSDVDERLTRDARRFYSLPGGAPAPNWLYAEKRGYTLIEPTARDFLAEVAFRISENERRVIDLAPRLGCACSGAVVGEPWTSARDCVSAMEPPRAVHEVLDHDVPLEMAVPIEPWPGSAADGEPTLALPLAELAALHDPGAKAPPVRQTPPPPVPRASRPVVRPAGEPATGAGLMPGRPRPPEPKTAPRAEPATSPRARAVTPPIVPVLPPVPPMPAHLAQRMTHLVPPPRGTPLSSPVIPPPAPVAAAAVTAPATGPVTAQPTPVSSPRVTPLAPPKVTPLVSPRVTPPVVPAVAAAAAAVNVPAPRATPVMSPAVSAPVPGAPAPEAERSRFAPPLPVARPAMGASHFDLPSEGAAAIAAPAPAVTPAPAPAPVAPPKSDLMSQIDAAELNIVAAAIAAGELRAAAGVPAPSAIFVEERNNSAMLEGPTVPRRPKRNRTKLYVMMAMCAALVVAGAGIVMFRIIPKNKAAPQPVSAPVVPSAAPAAPPITDSSMDGGHPATVTDTVALMGAAPMQRLPVGPAAVPAAYAGKGGRALRAADATVAAPANPAAVYSPGAAPAISTSQPAAAVAAPKVAASVKAQPKALPKTAAELRASAAFRGQLTPEAAAEMAAVRTEVAAKKQRDDSIKRAADSAGAR